MSTTETDKDLNEDVEVSETERTLVRNEEDQTYVPVIIKRNDQAVRHPDDILKLAIEEALEQHNRPKISLLLSAITAGLILGFAGMCVALMTQLFPLGSNPLLVRLACAFVYPLGFIVCIMSGTQLFTEQTATAMYSVLDRKSTLKSLFSLLTIVLLGNILGTFFSSILLFLADPVINASLGYGELQKHLIHFTFPEVFFSAVLAGWLMAQGGWLILATTTSSIQLICIYIVTFIIGFGGLHHSIAGSAEIFSGIIHASDPEYLNSFLFIVSAILGNLLGGSFFVAVLNYAHIKVTQS
jgi:formate-nitrite transporter family protein